MGPTRFDSRGGAIFPTGGEMDALPFPSVAFGRQVE
jgi:hypothetical protein